MKCTLFFLSCTNISPYAIIMCINFTKGGFIVRSSALSLHHLLHIQIEKKGHKNEQKKYICLKIYFFVWRIDFLCAGGTARPHKNGNDLLLNFFCCRQCYLSVFLFLKYLADISQIKSAIGKHLF